MSWCIACLHLVKHIWSSRFKLAYGSENTWLVISKNRSSQHSRKLSCPWASEAHRSTLALTFGYTHERWRWALMTSHCLGWMMSHICLDRKAGCGCLNGEVYLLATHSHTLATLFLVHTFSAPLCSRVEKNRWGILTSKTSWRVQAKQTLLTRLGQFPSYPGSGSLNAEPRPAEWEAHLSILPAQLGQLGELSI